MTENSQLWTTNVRFARWDVQVSTGKLVRSWVVDESDQFVGPPLKFGDIIVHRRIPRGNRGVRVSAVSADNAAVQWVVDLGVPVIHVASPTAGRFDAVLATGAQFAIDPTQTVLNRAEYNADTFQARYELCFAARAQWWDGCIPEHGHGQSHSDLRCQPQWRKSKCKRKRTSLPVAPRHRHGRG